MRTTLTLDDDVGKAVQALAQASGRRVGQVVSDLLRRSLLETHAVASRNGLPLFRVEADAEIIRSDWAHGLLAGEQ